MAPTENKKKPALWGVVPAAGRGSRISSPLPKQYMPLAGVAVLQRTLEVLSRVPGMQNIIVATQPEHTELFAQLEASRDERVQTVYGSDLRAGSVAAGIAAVREQAGDDTWVLVHDAARPLVSVEDIVNLVASVIDAGAIGGLLAMPVKDTLKKTTLANSCTGTVVREGLWAAQTPQLFKAGALGDALSSAMTAHSMDASLVITDEASVFELLGLHPLLVEAHSLNMKITRSQDFILAEAILSLRTNEVSTQEAAAARQLGLTLK